MRLALIPLILCMGCVPLPTKPERCVPVAEAAAAKTRADGGVDYLLAWRQNYERAFEACK